MEHINHWFIPQGSLLEAYKEEGEKVLEVNTVVVVEPELYLHKKEEEARKKLNSGRYSTREIWTVIQVH